MENALSEFIDFLDEALSNVGEHYWVVHSAEDEFFLRERVFCYELYHQMRKIQDPDTAKDNIKMRYPIFSKIDIYAEPDKRGWADLTAEEKKNPDFIFHEKESRNNLVVMEVKCDINGDFVKDFNTLRSYVGEKGHLKYKCGVFFLYGHSMSEAVRKIKLLEIPTTDSDKIYAFTQKSKETDLERKSLKEIMEWS